jgi:hypothetical protein
LFPAGGSLYWHEQAVCRGSLTAGSFAFGTAPVLSFHRGESIVLTLWGASRRFCHRIPRRDFLQIGALGLGGLTLADILRLRAEGSGTRKPRAVIMI